MTWQIPTALTRGKTKLAPEPDLDQVLARWADARLSAHLVVHGAEEPTEDMFMRVFRCCEDVPSLVAKVRELENAA